MVVSPGAIVDGIDEPSTKYAVQGLPNAISTSEAIECSLSSPW